MAEEKNEVLLVVLVLVFTFILVYSPHFNYPYPLHADEWRHLELGKKLFEGEYEFKYLRYYPLYHIIIIPLFVLEKYFGLDPIFSYTFLPGLFAVFASLMLFLLVKKLTDNFWIALFSMLFFASLPSNVNLMGQWFATPFALSLSLVFIFFIFLRRLDEKELNKKNLFCLLLILILTIFIHPSSGIIFFPVLLIWGVLNFNSTKSKPYFLLVLVPFFIYSFIFFADMTHLPFGEIVNHFINSISFNYDSKILQPSLTENPINFKLFGVSFVTSQYFLPWLYGFMPFLLALYGLYYAIYDKKWKYFVIWFFIVLLLLFFYNITGLSFFVRRAHMIYLALISLVPLSAVGFYNLMIYIKCKLENKSLRLSKIILAALVLGIFILTFYNYGEQRKGTELYYLIDNEDYEAMIFLRTLEKGYTIAPLNKATAIYPITGNKVFSDLLSSYKNDQEKVKKFFSEGCNYKEGIIEDYNLKYVYSESVINCTFLREIYSNKRDIYEVV